VVAFALAGAIAAVAPALARQEPARDAMPTTYVLPGAALFRLLAVSCG